MSEHSNISWTDSTWNPVVGCTKVSAGCKNCYAEQWAKRAGRDMCIVNSKTGVDVASGSGIRRYDYVIVAKWLAQETYRHLLHRHDGTLRACDEAYRESVDADNIRSLATKLLNWKTEARKY